MNSADSMHISGNMQGAQENTPRKVDTFMQGSENQESTGAGSTHSSISPPTPLMHDITTATSPTIITGQQTTAIPVTVSQICTPTPAALGNHQILIDPTTGQHFLVSSAPPAPHPQIIYQPVYYSATPAQPVLYHPFTPAAHGAYVVAATPITASQTQIGASHMALGQRFSSTPSPPMTAQSTTGCFIRSVADFDDTRSTITTDERQTVFENPLKPTGRSHPMDLKQVLVSKNSVSSPHSSSTLSQHCSISDNVGDSPRTPTQKHPKDAALFQESLSTPVVSTNVTTLGNEGERTPLFGGAPAWWGENDASTVQVQNDSENTKSAVTGNACKPLKSIRMDIDLNEAFVDEESKKENKAKATQRASSTAFTVSFDSEEGSQKVNLSLQDAAKKTSSRRFMRRSMPSAGLVSKGTVAKIADLTTASSNPKQYLLNKMLMGVGEECIEEQGEPEMGSYQHGGRKQDTEDTLSEAGTYVVDGDQLNQMVISQAVKGADAESVSSETTTTQSTENPDSSVPLRVGSILPQINENVSNTSGGAGGKERRLCELLRLNSGRVDQCRGIGERQIVAPSTPPHSDSPRLTSTVGTHARITRRPDSSRVEDRQYSSHRLCAIASSSRAALQSQARRTQPVAGTNGMSDNSFRAVRCRSETRGDGGRYSMRFCTTNSKGNQASAAVVRDDRPPFRVGGSGRNQASGTKASKESAEMTAWLRRKDYNPMKAAAEAKKLLKARLQNVFQERQSCQQEADKFASNRSVSFHQGTRPNVPPIVRNPHKPRHNRSQDDLSGDNAACGPETILVNYSKGITMDLKKLRIAETSQDQTRIDGLENAVQQLTMKCNRSIELIRKSHQGHLSRSVENLLETAIKPAKDCAETVTEQLDRLSAAFDAIQKYLEENISDAMDSSGRIRRLHATQFQVSSTSLPASPSGSSPTASVTALSPSPSRRPYSAYQSKLAAVKRTSSGQKNL